MVWGVSPVPAEDAACKDPSNRHPIATGQRLIVLFGRFVSPCDPSPMPTSQYIFFPFNKCALQCSVCALVRIWRKKNWCPEVFWLVRTSSSEISMASSSTESKMSALKSELLYCFRTRSAGSSPCPPTGACPFQRWWTFHKPVLQVLKPACRGDVGTNCRRPDLITQDPLACKSRTLTTKQLP